MKGTYAVSNGKFAANCYTRGKYFYLGVHSSRKRASLATRLFRYWVSMGYDPLHIPRDWQPEPVNYVQFDRIQHTTLNRIIKSNGIFDIKPKDLLSLASELISLRVQCYGEEKTTRF